MRNKKQRTTYTHIYTHASSIGNLEDAQSKPPSVCVPPKNYINIGITWIHVYFMKCHAATDFIFTQPDYSIYFGQQLCAHFFQFDIENANVILLLLFEMMN